MCISYTYCEEKELDFQTALRLLSLGNWYKSNFEFLNKDGYVCYTLFVKGKDKV